jgi:CTP synthase
MLLEEQGLIALLHSSLGLETLKLADVLIKRGGAIWKQWKALTAPSQKHLDTVRVALVGKYTTFHDSYLSVIKSLEHAAMRCRRKLEIKWVDSEDLEPKSQVLDPARYHKAWHDMCTAQGILVPGGFGIRGTEGMIAAAKWAREQDLPYLGICLGMQIAVIEFARNCCGVTDATSEEFSALVTQDPKSLEIRTHSTDKQQSNGAASVALTKQETVGEVPAGPPSVSASSSNIIVFMPEIDKTTMGGNMRLGLRATQFDEEHPWSRLRALYGGKPEILERHRHRYEVNPALVKTLESKGLSFTGKDDTGVRMEVIEIKDRKWFVGVQFHPEYLSRVLRPSRPYLGFIAACSGVLDKITREENGEVSNGVPDEEHSYF